MSSRPTEPTAAFSRFQRYGLNAWVLIPSWVFGFFTWLTFFILGVRARRRDWILTGAGYAVFSALVFFALGRPEVENDDTANALLGFGLFVAWIGGAVHAGITYWISLRELAAQPARAPSGSRRSRPRDAAPAPTSDDLGLGFGNPAADYLASSRPIAAPPPEVPVEAPVEANTASQRTLTRLPGVTPDLARRWIAERQRRGGFRDIDDLATALELQPHEIVRLRPRLSFADPGQGPKRRRLSRGRVLDV